MSSTSFFTGILFCCSAIFLALNICSTIVSPFTGCFTIDVSTGFVGIIGAGFDTIGEIGLELNSWLSALVSLVVCSVFATNSAFNSASFIAWYTALNTKFSSSNLTSNFAGCTFTSTLLGFISIFKTKKQNFPNGNIPLYALSAAADKDLSFINLLFTKNIWYALFERAISGFPTTPLMCMSSYV